MWFNLQLWYFHHAALGPVLNPSSDCMSISTLWILVVIAVFRFGVPPVKLNKGKGHLSKATEVWG